MHMSEAEFARLLIKSPSAKQQFHQMEAMKKIAKTQKASKYRNQKVYIYEDGFISIKEKAKTHGKQVDIFDSVKEFTRWHELLLLQKSGKISNLQRQHALLIQKEATIHGEHILPIVYVADFIYQQDGKQIIEDVKPFDEQTKQYKTTKDFAIKWKMLKVKYADFYFRLY